MLAARPDPAIESFLTLLERGIATGQQVSSLPQGLVVAMLSAIQPLLDLGGIAGNVAL